MHKTPSIIIEQYAELKRSDKIAGRTDNRAVLCEKRKCNSGNRHQIWAVLYDSGEQYSSQH